MFAVRATSVASRRAFSTTASDFAALHGWLGELDKTPKVLTLHDAFHQEHLADLYATLPTRDGTFGPRHDPPIDALGYGHHLAFFHPRSAMARLRADGTDAEFCPPEPFTRRMWASGRMEWRRPAELAVGRRAVSTSTLAKENVERKGFEAVEGRPMSPMVFVKQQIAVTPEAGESPALMEERTHVYLPVGGVKPSGRKAREVKGLPDAQFALGPWTPNATTLFRFSALTFNGHFIHLDRDYAQEVEGYPERLVHGPLTALMLLETFAHQYPKAVIKAFEYRAHNPVVVNRPMHFLGAVSADKSGAQVWATTGSDGVVGMTGTIFLE